MLKVQYWRGRIIYESNKIVKPRLFSASSFKRLQVLFEKLSVNTMWSKKILSETVLFILLASVVGIVSSLPYYRTLPSSRLSNDHDKSTKEQGRVEFSISFSR